MIGGIPDTHHHARLPCLMAVKAAFPLTRGVCPFRDKTNASQFMGWVFSFHS